jgi:hypothetical protein
LDESLESILVENLRELSGKETKFNWSEEVAAYDRKSPLPLASKSVLDTPRVEEMKMSKDRLLLLKTIKVKVEKQVNIYEQLLEVEVRQMATGKVKNQASTSILNAKIKDIKNQQT